MPTLLIHFLWRKCLFLLILTGFSLLVNVVQTWDLIYAQIWPKSSKHVFLPHLVTTLIHFSWRKCVVLFIFTGFSFLANVMQTWDLIYAQKWPKLSKHDNYFQTWDLIYAQKWPKLSKHDNYFITLAHHVNPLSFEQMCGVTHIYRIFFASKCRANTRFDLCANMTKVKQTWYFITFAHHVNPLSLEQMCGVTHIYRLYFACKCRANMRFDLCANMTKVKQTWYFTTFAHHVNPFSLEQMCGITHICLRGKVVLNVYFLLHVHVHLQRCVNIA